MPGNSGTNPGGGDDDGEDQNETTVTFDFTSQESVLALNSSVTFNESTSQGNSVNDFVFKNGDVTITPTKGTASTDCKIFTTTSNDYQLRVYTNSSFTVASDKVITSIVVNNNLTNDFATVNTGTITKGKASNWTGSATSVTYTITANVQITSIVVTYGGGSNNPGGEVGNGQGDNEDDNQGSGDDVQGQEELFYTLSGSIKGSNSNYNESCEVAVADGKNTITWTVEGNTSIDDKMTSWRLGGKSITATDRAVYSNGAMNANISKIQLSAASATITVNSLTVVVARNSDFSGVVSTLTPAFEAGKVITIERPADADWTNCYYKFTYNVTNSTTSNKYVEFTGANFYTVK